MVEAAAFLEELQKRGFTFYTGVPDSRFKGFCDRLVLTLGRGGAHHSPRGSAVGWLRVPPGNRKTAVVQAEQRLGNAVNPTSLIDPKVYATPVLFIIVARVSPGTR